MPKDGRGRRDPVHRAGLRAWWGALDLSYQVAIVTAGLAVAAVAAYSQVKDVLAMPVQVDSMKVLLKAHVDGQRVQVVYQKGVLCAVVSPTQREKDICARKAAEELIAPDAR